MAREVAGTCPELRELVFLPGAPELGLVQGVPEAGHELTYGELLTRADGVGLSAVRERMAQLDPHDPINLQYTSGTTGFP
ncbi:AMP-binding protein, partial [Burkholderia sp. SIMBA_045]